MECAGCGHVFSLKHNLVKHLKRCQAEKPKMEKFRPGPPYECALCGKSYELRQNLVRHMHLHLPLESYSRKRVFVERYECAVCGRTYNRRHNLVRHIRISGCTLPGAGNSNLLMKNECSDCIVTFRTKSDLKKHLKTVHKNICNSSFVCAHCYRMFNSKQKLRTHITQKHLSKKKVVAPNDSLRCVLCGQNFCRTEDVLRHITAEHDVALVHEHLRFSSLTEFHQWKTDMQRNTTSVFVKMRYQQGRDANITRFKCHRSGSYKPRVATRHRRIKLQGSMKIGGFCPAAITVIESRGSGGSTAGAGGGGSSGSCRVSYVRTHLGHNVCDETELAHMYVSGEEKDRLAGKISMGVPYNRILTDSEVHVDPAAELQPTLDPLYLLNKQSLNNISATYRVKAPPEPPTVIEPYSVEAFVAEYHQSILFLKRAGVEDGDAFPMVGVTMAALKEEINKNSGNQTQLQLEDNDVVVVVMTKVQEELFRRHGNDIVTADGTFGTNEHNFVLHTFSVVDEWYEGTPVALALSNRNDRVFTDLFLRVVRQRLGCCLRVKTFLSEMGTTYYESWSRVMGPARFPLFCKWHVDDEWRRSARKIRKFEKRTETLKRLLELSTCLDEVQFSAELEALLTIGRADPDLWPFICYLEENFVSQAKSWAYCYRRDAGINTNYHLKAFDRCLKYFNGNFLKTATFIDYLSLINDFLELETKELTRKRIFGKLSTKLNCLRRRHDDVVNRYYVGGGGSGSWRAMSFEPLDDDPFGGWIVSVCDEGEESWSMFVVRTKKLECQGCKLYCEECNSCLHSYECTCRDNCIEYNMCVHIHALCLYLKENGAYSKWKMESFRTLEENVGLGNTILGVDTSRICNVGTDVVEDVSKSEKKVCCKDDVGVNDNASPKYDFKSELIETDEANFTSLVDCDEVRRMDARFEEMYEQIENVNDVQMPIRVGRTTEAEINAYVSYGDFG